MRCLGAICLAMASVLAMNACNDDDAVREAAKQTIIEENTPVMLPAAEAEGKIVSFDTSRIVLDNGTTIDLPNDPNTAVIVLVRHTETRETNSNLSEAGMARAGWLATQLQQANFLQVFCSKDNPSLQTANFVARATQSELNYLNTWDVREMAGTLVSSYRGKRVLLVATPQVVSQVLQYLTNRKKLKTPDSEFENMYVVFASELGKGELRHLIY